MTAELSKRRVVIAGMGVISSSGKDLVTLWKNVRGNQRYGASHPL